MSHILGTDARAELLEEVLDLREWKASSMAVERGWDEQEVARLLGIALGAEIKPKIQPKIEALLAEVEQLRKSYNHSCGMRIEEGRLHTEALKELTSLQRKVEELDDTNSHIEKVLQALLPLAKEGDYPIDTLNRLIHKVTAAEGMANTLQWIQAAEQRGTLNYCGNASTRHAVDSNLSAWKAAK